MLRVHLQFQETASGRQAKSFGRIGFIFQSFNLLPVLDARENIVLPLSIAGREPDPEWLERLIDTVRLRDRLTHRPSELSGGQQQRVAVARALAARPAVIFADEPTGNLDSKSSAEVLDLLRRAVDEFGQTVVMVTHEQRPRSAPTGSSSWPTGASSATPADAQGRAARAAGAPRAPGDDRDVGRARRDAGRRHVRLHRHDQPLVRPDLPDGDEGDRCGPLAARGDRVRRRRQPAAATEREPRRARAPRRRRRCTSRAASSTSTAPSSTRPGSASAPAARPTSSCPTPARPGSRASRSTRANGRTARARSPSIP